jgi:hypothetical protein
VLALAQLDYFEVTYLCTVDNETHQRAHWLLTIQTGSPWVYMKTVSLTVKHSLHDV